MVNGVTVATGRVQPARAGPQVREVAVGGRRFTPEQFRTQLRGGRFGGRLSGFGLTPQMQAEVVRQEVAQRQADIKRAQTLIEKSKAGLSALPPVEKVELKEIIKRVETSRLKPDVVARVGGLSRAQQLAERNRARLETEGRQLNFQKQSLDLRSQQIAAEQQNLSRLAQKGLLQSSLAVTFNKKVQRLNKDVKAFNQKVSGVQVKVARFKKAPVTRTPELVTRPSAAARLPVFQEFEQRVAAQRVIEPLIDVPAIGTRITQAEIAGREFGAAAIGPEPTVFGARVGAVGGRLIGGVEEAFRFTADVPLFIAETISGRPIRVPVRERLPEVQDIQSRLDVFLGRRPSLAKVTQAEAFRRTARIPFVGALTGAAAAVDPEGRVVITRPALRDFGTSLALFVGPEAFVAGARAARAGARVVTTQAARARLAARVQLEKALVPKLVQEQAKRLGVAPFQLTAAQLKRLEQVVPTFQEALTQRQLIDLRTLTRAKEFEERVKTVLTKQRGELKGFFREERGEFLPRRRRPTQPLLQVQRPELRVRRPTAVGTLTRFEERLLPVTTRKRFASFAQRPRVARALRVPSFLTGVTAARLGLGEADIFRTAEIQRTTLREFERFQERQREASLVGFSFLFGQPTAVRQRQRQREAERQRQIQRQFTRQFQPRPLPRVREIPRPPREPRIPKRPKAVLFPVPTLDFAEFRLPPQRKVDSYNAFVKTTPFTKRQFTKVTATPLPKSAALARGALITDVTIAQTFKIKKAKQKVAPKLFTFLNLQKFRQPPRRLNTFIERRAFAIDTTTEVNKLKVSKFLAREKKTRIRIRGVSKPTIVRRRRNKPKTRRRRKRRGG